MANRIAGITIEIGGDTTKLQSALKDVNKSLNTTNSGLKDVNKLLKLDPKNVTLLKQKQEYLTKAISDTEAKLKTEKEALKQMKAASTTDDVTEEQKALEREIAETEGKLKTLKKEYKDFGDAAAQAIKQTGQNIKDVGDKTTQAGKNITQYVTGPIVGIGTAAVKTAADFDEQMSKVSAISGATGKDLDDLRGKAREMGSKTKFSATEAGQAMEFMAMAGWKTGDMLDGVEGIMNLAAASGEDLASTSDIVTDAMTAFGLEAKDAGEFADVLAATSTNANTNVGLLGESFKYCAPVAGAMGYDVKDVATALGLMANNGIKGSQAGTALRTLFTNMAKPTEAMARTMDELGISLEDGNGNMKSFRDVMKDLRKGFGNTKIPADELTKQLEELEKRYENGEITEKKYNKEVDNLMTKAYGAEGALKAQAAASLAGKTGMSGLLAIVNSSDEDFKKLTNAVDNSKDSAQNMADTMQDNLSGQLTILKSQVEEAAISIGEVLMPTIRDIVTKVQEWVDKFNSLSDEQKKFIVKVALVIAAVGPLLIIIGTVVSSIGAIVTGVGGLIGLITGGGGVVAAAGSATAAAGGVTTAVAGGGGLLAALGGLATAAAPFLIGGAIVAGIVAAVVLIVKNWDKIKEGAKKLAASVKEKWEAIKEKTKETWENVKNKTSEVWNDVKTNVSTTISDAKTAVVTKANDIATSVKTKFESAKTSAKTAFDNLKTNVTTAIDTAKSTVTQKASDISSSIKTKFDTAKASAKSAFDTLKTNVSTAIGDAKTTVATKAADIASSIKGKFDTAASSAKTKAEDIKKNLVDNLSTAASDAASKAGDIASNLKSGLSAAATSAWNQGHDVARNLKDSVIKSVDSLIDKAGSISDKLKSGLNNAKVIAWNQGFDVKRNLDAGLGGGIENLLTNIGSFPGKVKEALDTAKARAANFSWKIPKPSMPHIKLKWNETTVFGKTFKYPAGFTTEWYKRAYTNPVMFTRPTVLQTPYGAKGFGDGNGGEIVLSDAKLRQIAGSGQTTYNVNVYGAEGQSVNALADAVQTRLVALQRQREAAGLA